MTPWWDGDMPEDDYDERRRINADELRRRAGWRCDWCGDSPCTCDDSLFDADELGLDPEEDDTRG